MGNKERQNRGMLDIPESLSERISKFEAKTAGKKRAPNSAQLPVKGVALAGRVATELVVGIAVGAFLGWIIDRWLGTTPVFMLILFFLGAAGGIMNIWRVLTGRGMGVGLFNDYRDHEEIDLLEDQSDSKN